MTGRERITAWVAGVLLLGGAVGTMVWMQRVRPNQQPVVVSGVVLVRDNNPANQTPISGADVTAATASAMVSTKSDVSGLYRVSLPPRSREEPIMLTFEHSGYLTMELTAPAGMLVVARMASSAPLETPVQKQAESVIATPRIRYSVKNTMATNIGSAVETFDVENTGNVPCNNSPPCSPDNEWKAASKSYTMDAGEGNDYRNVRVSCIAGPCPFTKIESETQSGNNRLLKVTVLDWSDPTTFLVEAEVSQTRVGDIVRQSYPVIFGSTMNFTLPPGAEGPSIEAELNRNDIVFPLGPDLILSWANCTMKVSPGQGQLYRCELKAGYQFRH